MSEEIYTKEEHYQDWRSENRNWLIKDFLEENELDDEFEAYCRQEFKDRN